jgi:hypothetical protein
MFVRLIKPQIGVVMGVGVGMGGAVGLTGNSLLQAKGAKDKKMIAETNNVIFMGLTYKKRFKYWRNYTTI